MDEHGPGQGPRGRRDLPLPPGAAQAAARVPPLRARGGGPPRRARLPRALRGQQAGAAGYTVSDVLLTRYCYACTTETELRKKQAEATDATKLHCHQLPKLLLLSQRSVSGLRPQQAEVAGYPVSILFHFYQLLDS